ncbi:efflux RND transporter periplasmic adaptor subunit [Halomonas sp. ZH2S]|uniref:Efflux RND transporter periplasmic adaptor subunit n=1 Tax=Vreelandella zhuhanensis TaxID=2684210 RepID=A0A7X3H094_9GAMM|nr:efflux RND transporter periplasmic adaptor subunit [Halomonas zhuhanensis]MWJ28158.1 efflux RND transporter periplasmic adaptor subunit [Halomonas zhuhanensis]
MKLRFRVLLACFLISMPGMASSIGDDLSTAVVTRETLDETLVLDGLVEAVKHSTVSAQTSGRVTELPFDVDDRFVADTLILRLEDTEQRARLNQARAALEEAEANLVDARQRFERIRAIRNRDLASEQAFDQATNRLNAARARREHRLASVSEAEQQLAYTQVRAASDGVFTRRHVEPGEAVRPGQPLFDTLALAPLRVEAALPRRHLSWVRENPRIRVSLAEGQPLATDTLTIYPQADPRSDTVRLRLRLNSPGAGVLPGMLAKVAVVVASREALWIPAESLIRRSELRAVFVLDEEDQPRLRQVRVGIEEAGRLEVLAGLDAGERILADPKAQTGRAQ